LLHILNNGKKQQLLITPAAILSIAVTKYMRMSVGASEHFTSVQEFLFKEHEIIFQQRQLITE